jgi:hypothetical protein
VFVSHASADTDLARAVVTLVEKAIKLRARQIRCTSVPGYKLPVGADANEQLRREVFDARSFVALLTPSSMKSQYVLFELGARWGAARHLAPVLAGGMTVGQLRAPLSSLQSLELYAREGVTQFIEDLAEYLKIQMEPMAAFQGAVDAVIEVASREVSTPDSVPAEPEFLVSEDEVRVLQALILSPRNKAEVSSALKCSGEKALYYLNRLEKEKLVFSYWGGDKGTRYQLDQRGREFLVSSRLL